MIYLILKKLYRFKLFKRVVPSLLRYFGGKTKIKIFNFNFYIYLQNSIEREIFLNNSYDYDRFLFLEKYINKFRFDYFFDIGSYTGYYSLYFAKNSSISNIIAFEPNSLNFNKLIKNIKLNNLNIITHNFACSDVEGDAIIWFTNSNKLGGSSILNKNDIEIDKYEKNKLKFLNIKTNTLDKIYGHLNNKQILIKIDVERHEINVLDGGFKFFNNNNILLQIENEKELKDKVFEKLSKFNFQYINSIDDDHYFSNFINS